MAELSALDTFILSKSYTDDSIEGTSGVLAGKNCQILSKEPISDGEKTGTRITFSWYRDNETVARTDYIDVWDGDKGDTGEKGDAGFSPEISVEESTESSYKLKITTESDEFITPNLKGGGSGGGVNVDVSGESLVFTY